MKRLVMMVIVFFSWLCFYPLTIEAAPKVVIETYDYEEDHVHIQYPHFDGMTDNAVQGEMNSSMEALVNDYASGMRNIIEEENGRGRSTENYSAKMEYGVHFNDNNVLSLTVHEMQFTGGNTWQQKHLGYTFDLRTGKVLSFTDLYKWDYDSRNYVYKQILKQVRDQTGTLNQIYGKPLTVEEINGGLTKSLSNEQYVPTYYLTAPDKCVFIFQKYEIAGGFRGMLAFEVSIPQMMRKPVSGLSIFSVSP